MDSTFQFHANTVNTFAFQHRLLTSGDPISFRPSSTPRSSTWTNRKKNTPFSWQVRTPITSSLPSKCIRRVTWFLPWKDQAWQTHVRFWMQVAHHFRFQPGNKHFVAASNSCGRTIEAVSSNGTKTCSHVPPYSRSCYEILGSHSAYTKGYWLLPPPSAAASNLRRHHVVSPGDMHTKTLQLIQRCYDLQFLE
jgi:hypothetical protein